MLLKVFEDVLSNILLKILDVSGLRDDESPKLQFSSVD